MLTRAMEPVLHRAGLFPSLAPLARLLGVAGQGPLDAIVDTEPLWRSFNDHLNGRLGMAELEKSVDHMACEADDLFELMFDVVTGYPVALLWPISERGDANLAGGCEVASSLLARGISRERIAAELREPRTGKPQHPLVHLWVTALLLALARTSDAELLVRDPELHERFLHAADTTASWSIEIARRVVELQSADLRWQLVKTLPFYQHWSSLDRRRVVRGAWSFTDFVPAVPEAAEWLLDALEQCEPEATPIDRLAEGIAHLGEAWTQAFDQRRSRLAPHQLEAAAQARRAIGASR